MKEETVYQSAVKLGELCATIDDIHKRHTLVEGAILNLLLGTKLCECEQIGILERALHQINVELDEYGALVDNNLSDLR